MQEFFIQSENVLLPGHLCHFLPTPRPATDKNAPSAPWALSGCIAKRPPGMCRHQRLVQMSGCSSNSADDAKAQQQPSNLRENEKTNMGLRLPYLEDLFCRGVLNAQMCPDIHIPVNSPTFACVCVNAQFSGETLAILQNKWIFEHPSRPSSDFVGIPAMLWHEIGQETRKECVEMVPSMPHWNMIVKSL